MRGRNNWMWKLSFEFCVAHLKATFAIELKLKTLGVYLRVFVLRNLFRISLRISFILFFFIISGNDKRRFYNNLMTIILYASSMERVLKGLFWNFWKFETLDYDFLAESSFKFFLCYYVYINHCILLYVTSSSCE